jgi:uncharacterized protein with PIN domain
MQKTTWYCDVCDKEIENKFQVYKTSVAVKAVRGNFTDNGFEDLDLCPKCRKRLREVQREHFAEINEIDGKRTVEIKL